MDRAWFWHLSLFIGSGTGSLHGQWRGTLTISSAWPLGWSFEPCPWAVPAVKGAVAPALAPGQALTVPVSWAGVPCQSLRLRPLGTDDSSGAPSPPTRAGASVCHAGFTTPPCGNLLARGSTWIPAEP